jgi:hypothetical protein
LFEEGLDVVIALNSSVCILNKIKAFGDFQGLSELATGRNAFGIVGKESELEKVTSTEPQSGFVKIFCAYEKVRYIEEAKVQKNVEIFNSWKIFTSKANGGAGLLGDNKPVSIIGKAYVAEFKRVMEEMVATEQYTTWWETILYSRCYDIDIHTIDAAPYFWSEIDYIEDYEKIVKFVKEKHKNGF